MGTCIAWVGPGPGGCVRYGAAAPGPCPPALRAHELPRFTASRPAPALLPVGLLPEPPAAGTAACLVVPQLGREHGAGVWPGHHRWAGGRVGGWVGDLEVPPLGCGEPQPPALALPSQAAYATTCADRCCHKHPPARSAGLRHRPPVGRADEPRCAWAAGAGGPLGCAGAEEARGPLGLPAGRVGVGSRQGRGQQAHAARHVPALGPAHRAEPRHATSTHPTPPTHPLSHPVAGHAGPCADRVAGPAAGPGQRAGPGEGAGPPAAHRLAGRAAGRAGGHEVAWP